MVTQKLDLHQMSERSIRIWKDTYKQAPSAANFGFIRFVYIYISGKWLQKEHSRDCRALCFEMGV